MEGFIASRMAISFVAVVLALDFALGIYLALIGVLAMVMYPTSSWTPRGSDSASSSS